MTSTMPWPSSSHHAQADRATGRQRIDRIEDEVGHQFAQLAGRTLNDRVALRLDVQADRPTFGLGRVAPARSCQLRRLAHHAAEVHAFAVRARARRA